MNQKRLHQVLEYDEITGIFTWKQSLTRATKVGHLAGALHKDGYVYIGIDKKVYSAHRLAWLYVYGDLPKYIDHINNVRNDNSISNLRSATKNQNGYNMKLSKKNTSGIKGVCFDKYAKKWQSKITVDGKKINLGYFDDIELAELVVFEARIKFHKEFCNHGTVI